MTGPRVAIIILNWNGLGDTIECLEALKRIVYPDYRVIVVDNGSKGDDVRVLREGYADYVHIIENGRNCGFAEGSNIGMRYALDSFAPDYCLLLNNDVVVDPGFLTEMVRVAETDGRVGFVGPAVYDYYEPAGLGRVGAGVRIDWWRGTTPRLRLASGGFGGHPVREVDALEGCCMLVRKELLDHVGLLDQEYFAYWEETDWCVRGKRAGYRVCCALNSRIWHKGQHSYTDTFKLYYFLRNNILFMRKNADARHLAVFLVYFLCVSLPTCSLKPFLVHPLKTVGALSRALLWNLRR